MEKIFTKLFLAFCIASSINQSYGQGKAIKVDLAAVKTKLKQNAMGVGINYIKSLDSLFKQQDILMTSGNSLFQLTPQFNVQTGDGDAFSSINAKLTGLFMCFHDTSIADIVTPNTSRGFQTFPVSAGIESNNKFNIINGVVEAGWVPWYQTQGNKKTAKWLKHTKFGVFIQGGYKFGMNTIDTTSIGGETDQSKEKTNHPLLRTKGSFGIDTKSLFELSGVGVGLAGNADGWYDFLNKEVYYTLQANLRFFLTKNKDKSFDFKYQKGSGAPNFNRGDQYGIGLTMAF